GVVIANELSTVMESNLIERNSTGGVEILKGKECRLENNTLVGMKREDFGILAKSSSNPKHGVLRNNILYRFARAFDGGTRMSRLPKKWEIRRNCVFNCDFENGQNLPDLLENYKVDPIFHNPNGKGEEDFTPESGSNVCKASARYDWGKDRYCGAFQCGEKKSSKGAVTIRILSPAQDGDIVPRSIEFRAVLKVCQGKKVASWGIFVNNNLEQQSRGISELESFQGCDEAKIEASIPSLPYGKSVIRLVVNGEAGERWAAERTVHTARCAEYRKRWVLLVGVSDYNEEGSIPDLRYAAADAIALEKLFNQRSPHAPNRDVEVILLTDAQATREGLRQALFGRIAPCARAEDEVIIFFAGHGLASRDRFFLALHDSNLDRLELTGYEMQELRDVIHYNVKSNRIVLFFDVCHSGAMNIEREPA
ncbi:MAG: CHAT domain-containing protein, partial [Desulfobacterales bacterium]|nr:CHAT domain-containing protein [Desulfobacterales bacterium]